MADTLFGPTPQELQALLKADRQAFLDRAATVSPAYSAGAGVGSLLGGVVSSIFGLENPELKKANDMIDIQKRIRQENPGLTDKGAYYDIAANYLDEKGYTAEATKALELANQFRVSEEDRGLKNRLTEAQISNYESEAQARLSPKPYEAKSDIGKLRADLAYYKSINDPESAKAVESEIDAKLKAKDLKPQEKADQVIYDALVKKYNGDEEKAAVAFNNISVDQKMRIAAAGAGNSLDKALTVLLETNKAKDKENAIKAVDSKIYGETVADKLRETYPDLTEAESNQVLIDYKNAKKKALRMGKEDDEAESYAENVIASRVKSIPGFLGFGTKQSYAKTPVAPPQAPAPSALPAGAVKGKQVSSGQYKGKYEVRVKGKLVGYSD